MTSHNTHLFRTLTTSMAIVCALALGVGLTAPMDARAELIINDDYAGITIVADGSQLIDVNDDGIDDFELTVSINSGDPEPFEEGSMLGYGISIYGENLFALNPEEFILQLAEGDAVDGSVFGDPGSSGELYQGSDGPWGKADDHGFVAFKFFAADVEDKLFGWLELTRGSLSIGRIGYSNVVGEGAPIPTSQTVPEPGALLLLASGAAGLLGYRRRRMALD